MNARFLQCLAALSVAFLLAASQPRAAPGDLDPSFGTAGVALLAGPSGDDRAQAVATDSQGRVVTAGYAYRGGHDDIAVTRTRADGTPDPAFNGTGTRLFNWPTSAYAYGLAIDAGGRIVVVGHADGGLLVARLTADGAFDSAFATDGTATGLVAGMTGMAVTIDASGRIVVAGNANYEFRVVRLTDGGAPDTTFNGTGTATTAVGTGEENPHAVAIDAAGRIVVAGFARNGFNYDIAVARFLPTGALDTAFNGTGTFVGPGNNELATSVAIDGAGRIVLAGPSIGGTAEFRVARLTASGAYDGTFGSGGRVSTAFNLSDSARSVAIDGAGRIVVAGTAYTGSAYSFAIARYLQSGALDPDFGTGGKVTAIVPGKSFITHAMALDVAGRIVCAGDITPTDGTTSDFAVIRRLPDGAEDPSFAGGAVASANVSRGGGEMTSIARQPDGRIVFAGGVYDGSMGYEDFMVGRLNADGTPDESFGPLGMRVTRFASGNSRATSVAVDSLGRIVVAGESRTASYEPVVTVQRFLPDGTPDASFGVDGTSTTVTDPITLQVNAVAIDPFDRIVVAGYKDGPSTQDMLVVRLTDAGALDTAFNGGSVLVDFFGAADLANALVLDASGRIVLAGRSGPNMAVARLNSYGQLDVAFNSTGMATVAPAGSASDHRAMAAAIDGLGRIVLAGEAYGAGAYSETIVRLTAAGALDTSFNDSGRVVVPAIGGGGSRAHAVKTDAANRPVTAGQLWGPTNRTSLRRYTDAGLVDASFGGTGLVALDVATDPSSDLAFALAIGPDGRILAGGVAYLTVPPQMFVLRVLGEESPAAFSFTPQAGVAIGSAVTSNTITVTGVTGTVPVSVIDGEYSLGCSATFTNSPGLVVNSTTLCVRHRASGLPATSTTTTLRVGATSASFTSTTARAASSASVVSSTNPSMAGAVVTFSASVAGAFGTPTGSVTFKADGVAIGSASLDGAGLAQLATTQLVSGARSITAEYAGDAKYLAATSPAWPQTVSPLATVARPRGDFSGDRKADLVWRDASGGLALWRMEGTAIAGTFFGVVATDWQVADVGDADGDGKADLFWWNATLGSGYLWFLDGTTVTGFADLGILGPQWNFVGVADFDGDGKSDILFQRPSDGQLYAWLMDGGAILAQGSPGTAASPWQVMDLADFDGDGKADIVFRNTADGGVTIWKMDGLGFVSDHYLGVVDAGFWQVVAAADFDADGKADLLWAGANGDVWVWRMDGAAIVTAASLGNAGPGWAVRSVSDFTGDGKADIVWRFVDGTTWLWAVDGATVASMAPIANPGGSWQIVGP